MAGHFILSIVSFFRWVQGYNGSATHYINKQTICFVCGNNIKFVNIRDKKESVLPSPGDGVGALAVSAAINKVGFAELKPNPKIFIYSLADFTQPKATLKSKCMSYVLQNNLQLVSRSLITLICSENFITSVN